LQKFQQLTAQFYAWPKKSLVLPTNAGWTFNACSDLEAKALNIECFILPKRCLLEGTSAGH